MTVPPKVVAAVVAALDEARFAALPEVLNEAHGAVVAFSTTVEAIRDGQRHAVTAYRHGTPAAPEVFRKLVANVRELLLAARPAVPSP